MCFFYIILELGTNNQTYLHVLAYTVNQPKNLHILMWLNTNQKTVLIHLLDANNGISTIYLYSVYMT